MNKESCLLLSNYYNTMLRPLPVYFEAGQLMKPMKGRIHFHSKHKGL